MRFIHVGVGGFGARWVQVLKASSEAEVVAMVDTRQEALDAACQTGGYDRSICHPTLEAALAAVQADAVVVCTPPEHHKAPVLKAFQHGLHVISEKPMADSFANCKEMLQAAYYTGQTYVISQNYRYQTNPWSLARRVAGGLLGEVGQVKVDFFMGHDFGGGFRHEMAYPLVVDMSIHHFDLMRFITGLDAVSVQGVAWNPPWSNYKGDCSSSLTFELSNGAHLVYNASWCSKGQFNGWDGNWQIECEKGTLVYQNNEIRQYNVPHLYKVESVEEVEKITPDMQGQDWVLDNFISSIGAGQRPPTDVYDNIRSVGMVFAAVEALETGRKVPILEDDQIARILAEQG